MKRFAILTLTALLTGCGGGEVVKPGPGTELASLERELAGRPFVLERVEWWMNKKNAGKPFKAPFPQKFYLAVYKNALKRYFHQAGLSYGSGTPVRVIVRWPGNRGVIGGWQSVYAGSEASVTLIINNRTIVLPTFYTLANRRRSCKERWFILPTAYNAMQVAGILADIRDGIPVEQARRRWAAHNGWWGTAETTFIKNWKSTRHGFMVFSFEDVRRWTGVDLAAMGCEPYN